MIPRSDLVKAGSIVRHFKGDLYIVIEVAKHTETREKLMVYRALYGEGDVWVRPYEMFMEEVPENRENPTGQTQRFEVFEPKKVG